MDNKLPKAKSPRYSRPYRASTSLFTPPFHPWSKSPRFSGSLNKQKILDIAMNLNRIGNWAADNYSDRKKRIYTFISDTTIYIESLDKNSFKAPFKKTLEDFLRQYKILANEGLKGPKNPLYWAEKMMTWGNILTHRSKLIQE